MTTDLQVLKLNDLVIYHNIMEAVFVYRNGHCHYFIKTITNLSNFLFDSKLNVIS